jgi:hypothetical protein
MRSTLIGGSSDLGQLPLDRQASRVPFGSRQFSVKGTPGVSLFGVEF